MAGRRGGAPGAGGPGGAPGGGRGGWGFRPCIDIHAGRVKQIVGSTLRDLPGEGGGGGPAAAPVTNFESELSSGEYARMCALGAFSRPQPTCHPRPPDLRPRRTAPRPVPRT